MSLDETATAVQRGALSPVEFFKLVSVDQPGAIQGLVFRGRNGGLNSHVWNRREVSHAEWVAAKVSGRECYTTMAAYEAEKVSDYKGRTTENVVAVRGFWVDVEGTKKKGDTPYYPGARAVLVAVKAFVKATGLTPNAVVSTGSGGVHLHYVLAAPVGVAEWLPRAKALATMAKRHGFLIDEQCTTDAARVMRAPGSVHQTTGETVTARRLRPELYTLEEFDRLVGFDVATQPDSPAPARRYDLAVNGDMIGSVRGKFSYIRAAQQCGAMHRAAQANGADVAYPVWLLAVKTADLSTEGRAFAHQISSGHESYQEDETDRKLESLTGGPAGCEAWGTAYGAGGPCESCDYRGKIKNPAVQLGADIDTSPPGSVVSAEPENVVEWVGELNKRFALVRHGTKLVIVDFQTPSMSGRGVALGIGFLDVAAFRSMMNGRFAPVQKAGEKQRALADAWLSHQQRRQYEGLVYAPGEVLEANMLNLWQGFTVAPVQGDVSLWLELLAALVPIEADRKYALRWIAWKIQNPGGVPDTILIFPGPKGAGKNSLFNPVIDLFGRHAMLADDPELIAGRFTWHLMSLSFAVLDEAVFVGDPRQADRVKSRVTAKTMHYEQKGMDPVQGVNRCAYVMLTNHSHVWQATSDERRAVVVEVGETLRGNVDFWNRYHTWSTGDGPAALLHYLQSVDLTGFNPRVIPKGEALRKQVELTALRAPAAAWWHQCLSEGAVRWRDGMDRVAYLDETNETEIDRTALRLSYEQSAAVRGRVSSDWASAARRLVTWSGATGIRKTRTRVGGSREWRDVLPALGELRAAFTAATQVEFSD